MEAIEKIIRILNRGFIILGGIAVLLLMILATGNVCLRVFQMPYRGAYELVSFLGALVTAFALGHTQIRKSHIIVDILSTTYPAGMKRLLDAISYLISLVFFAFLSREIFKWSLKLAQSGELSGTLKIIYYPFVFCVALGFTFLSLCLALDFLKTFLRRRG
jgi:TRAP-type C4-dicarboxylate transport system permease small subunit